MLTGYHWDAFGVIDVSHHIAAVGLWEKITTVLATEVNPDPCSRGLVAWNKGVIPEATVVTVAAEDSLLAKGELWSNPDIIVKGVGDGNSNGEGISVC
ncbi:hypothetical protein ES708_22525 [subsurface metagenome]